MGFHVVLPFHLHHHLHRPSTDPPPPPSRRRFNGSCASRWARVPRVGSFSGRTLRTFFAVLRRRNLSFFRLFNHSILILMSFLWLEFSQSFQIFGILLTTSIYSVVYGYRFWTAIGLRSACFPFVINFQMVLLGCNVVCHVGVLLLHVKKGGCEIWKTKGKVEIE
ncbi:hypothetical protein R6Q57_019993 [Mikania cordata]